MGQTEVTSRTSNQSHRSYYSIAKQSLQNKRIEHEGLLKLRGVPFKNCLEIQTESGSFFLENVDITLKDLLESRMYTNKLFPKEDIERLIENLVYTLAYLAEKDVTYKDINPENIFYDDGTFKLLPNELILEFRYQKFLKSQRNKQPNDKEFVTVSPQMIIAFRCKESVITQRDILDKSNVFCLGLLLLEVTTLLPSSECYDTDACEILDEVVTERIELVKDYYSNQIAFIIANMLDYDYTERMGLKQVSIFVNRELNRQMTANSKIVKELSNKKKSKPNDVLNNVSCSQPVFDEEQTPNRHSKTVSICKSRVQPSSEQESRVSKPTQNHIISEKKHAKTNKVYINGGALIEDQQQPTIQNREERNKIYMKATQDAQQRRLFENEQLFQNQRSHTILRQISHTSNVGHDSSQNRLEAGKLMRRKVLQRSGTSINSQLPIPLYQQKISHQEANRKQQQNRFPQSFNQNYGQKKQTNYKNSSDYLGYRMNPQSQIQKLSNNYQRPSFQKFGAFQSKESYDEQPSFSNNYINNDCHKQESNQTYQKAKQTSFGHRFRLKQSPMNEDSGSRGYFDNFQNLSSKQKNILKDQDNSLTRIKSEIQRSRKLIEQFKRGQTAQF